jgi:hypothetical protein
MISTWFICSGYGSVANGGMHKNQQHILMFVWLLASEQEVAPWGMFFNLQLRRNGTKSWTMSMRYEEVAKSAVTLEDWGQEHDNNRHLNMLLNEGTQTGDANIQPQVTGKAAAVHATKAYGDVEVQY